MIAFIEILVFTYLAGCVFYNLLFAVAGKFFPRRDASNGTSPRYNRIAVLVPAYKEDEIILSTVASYAGVDYPRELFDVVVIADSLQDATIALLRQSSAIVVPVKFDKSTKSRSLNAAFAQLDENKYDIAIIADADNVLASDFLLKINAAYNEGEHAIQAQRVAKNLDTPFAILDAANEMIANHINRKGANALGLSASLIGSGIAFDFKLIKQSMLEVAAIGGFDKVLQQLIVKKGYFIVYLESALIFDEKVANAAAFENQRRRWVSSQFVYLRQYLGEGFRALLRGKIDYFYMATAQNMLLPRMLLVAGMVFMTAVYLLLGKYLYIPALYWVIATLAYAVSLLLPLPGKFFTNYMWVVIRNLPRVIGIMLAVVFKLKGANKTFIHTAHSKTEINNPLLNVSRK